MAGLIGCCWAEATVPSAVDRDGGREDDETNVHG